MSSSRSRAPDGDLAKVGLVVGVLLIVGLFVFVTGYHQVPEGHVGVYKRWGAVTGADAAPGAHLTLPVAQSVQNVEVRPRTYTMADTRGEGDKARQDAIEVQSVNGTTFRVDVTVRYRVDGGQAPGFVEQWNEIGQAERRLIRPTVRSQVRDTGSAIASSTLFTRTGRQEMERAAREALNERFENEPLVLEAIQIRNVHIPEDYQQSLNEKEIAKQRVQREEFRVQRERRKAQKQIVAAEADARERLIRANATARSNYIIARSLNRNVLVHEYIGALDRTNTVYIPLGEGGLPTYLDVNGSQSLNQSEIPEASIESGVDTDGDVDTGTDIETDPDVGGSIDGNQTVGD